MVTTKAYVIYREAMANARVAYEEAVAPILEACQTADETIDKAWAAYTEAMTLAHTAFEEALVKEYDGASK